MKPFGIQRIHTEPTVLIIYSIFQLYGACWELQAYYLQNRT